MSNDMIYLNVGGVQYSTTRSTLTKYPNSMIGAMFKPYPAQVDKDGRFFIDRNGPMFEYILQFLRSGELTLPDGFKNHQLLKCEVDYYQILPLVESLKNYERKLNVKQTMICISLMQISDYQDHRSDVFFFQRLNGKFEKIFEQGKAFSRDIRYDISSRCNFYSKELIEPLLDGSWILDEEKLIFSQEQMIKVCFAHGFNQETMDALLTRVETLFKRNGIHTQVECLLFFRV